VIGLAAITVGVMFAAAVYLLLSRNTQRLVIGFLLLSNAVNLLVLASAGLPEGAGIPFADAPAPRADPLPHAFILTAIVIGLAAAAFLMALAVRTRRDTGTDELEGGGGGRGE
jgi:multisubunit Na+/H+ antiporter MnhC subunit